MGRQLGSGQSPAEAWPPVDSPVGALAGGGVTGVHGCCPGCPSLLPAALLLRGGPSLSVITEVLGRLAGMLCDVVQVAITTPRCLSLQPPPPWPPLLRALAHTQAHSAWGVAGVGWGAVAQGWAWARARAL